MLHRNSVYQTVIACAVLSAFLQDIVRTESDPGNTRSPRIWWTCEVFFLGVFTFELANNLWGEFHRRQFWCSFFNLFDIFLVTCGLIRLALQGGLTKDASSISYEESGAEFQVLQAVPALRVLRIFHRIRSLRPMVNMFKSAVFRCLSTLLVMLMISSMFAIIGVTVFRRADVDVRRTERGLSYGDEYWGNFRRALNTLFQVWTGDSWSEAIARPLIFCGDGEIPHIAAIFFLFYILINTVFLLSVVTSVFVDTYTNQATQRRAELEAEQLAELERELEAGETAPKQSRTGGRTKWRRRRHSLQRVAKVSSTLQDQLKEIRERNPTYRIEDRMQQVERKVDAMAVDQQAVLTLLRQLQLQLPPAPPPHELRSSLFSPVRKAPTLAQSALQTMA